MQNAKLKIRCAATLLLFCIFHCSSAPLHPAIPCAVELPGYTGTSRMVTISASGGASVQSWPLTLAFSNGVASFALTNVPTGTTHLSAKTAWHLRRRLSIATPLLFTGTNALRGGDLNGDNVVNFLDFATLARDWYTTHQVSDINGDGWTSFPDYSLLVTNYFTAGDAE